MALAAATDLERLVRREHAAPHDILGAHAGDGGVVIRAFRPSAAAVRMLPAMGEPVELESIHPGGVICTKRSSSLTLWSWSALKPTFST